MQNIIGSRSDELKAVIEVNCCHSSFLLGCMPPSETGLASFFCVNEEGPEQTLQVKVSFENEREVIESKTSFIHNLYSRVLSSLCFRGVTLFVVVALVQVSNRLQFLLLVPTSGF